MPVITTIDDLRELAQRRVPKMFFDYAESGSYTEQTLRDNTSDFDKIRGEFPPLVTSPFI